MKLVYAGSDFCYDNLAFKRLLLISEDLAFLDRPSVTFGNWGTIGGGSYSRRFDWTGCPVNVSTIPVHSGPAGDLYLSYVEADLENLKFCNAVLRGIKTSDQFAGKFIQLDGNYGEGKTGRSILNTLRQQHGLSGKNFKIENIGRHGFDTSTIEALQSIFQNLVVDASIQVTTALFAAEETGAVPITEDPHFAELLSLRTADNNYVGETSRAAPYLGISLAKSVIPDQALAEIDVSSLLNYRESTEDAYRAWVAEIERAAAQFSGLEAVPRQDEIHRIIHSDLAPKLTESEREMIGVRDDLFADILKKVVKWEFPTLSIAYLSGLGVTESFVVFAGALVPIAPDTVDYFFERKRASRNNAMTYLLKVTK